MNLYESLTDIIYIFDSMEGIIKKINSNKIPLNLSTMDKNTKEKMYYLDTFRNKSNAMFKYEQSDNSPIVIVKLDGGLLNKRYGGHSYHSEQDTFDPDDNISDAKFSKDRLITDKPYIENFVNYILHIDILMPEYGYTHDYIYFEDYNELEDLIKLLDKLRIDYTIYSDKKDIMISNKSKSISFDDIPKPNKNYDSENNDDYADIHDQFNKTKENIIKSIADSVINIDVNSFTKKFINKIINDDDFFLNKLEEIFSKIFNEKSSNSSMPSSFNNEVHMKLAQLLLKNNIKTFEDYIEYIKNKFTQ